LIYKKYRFRFLFAGTGSSLSILFYFNSNSLLLWLSIIQFMDIGERIKSFALLGETLQNYLKNCSATIGGIGATSPI